MEEELNSKTQKVKNSIKSVVGLCCLEGIDPFQETKFDQQNVKNQIQGRKTSLTFIPLSRLNFCITKFEISSGSQAWFSLHDFV